MSPDARLANAETSLDRILKFFPRVDSKASFIAALDTAMLGLIAANVSFADVLNWCIIVPAFSSSALLVISLCFIYRCQYPNLQGGTSSLVYFQEIATRTEATFIKEFLKTTEDDYARDILGQVWRNSEILKQKFAALKVSFIATGLAILPWVIILSASTYFHNALHISAQ